MYNFGFAFEDSVGNPKKRERKHTLRLSALGVLGAGLIVLIVGRLVQLQIVAGDENRQRSDENRILVRRMQGPRGAIFDRNGEALTRNVPIYKKFETLNSKSETNSKSQTQNSKLTTITREEFEEAKKRGEEVVQEVGREYIYPEAFAHVVGYIGEISQEELDNCSENSENPALPAGRSENQKNQSIRKSETQIFRLSDSLTFRRSESSDRVRLGSEFSEKCDYSLGDMVGKMGIEREFDRELRGVDGGQVVERGPSGEVVRGLSVLEPKPGSDVRLTIDAGLQRKAAEILAAANAAGALRKGGVIASDPRTGEILALVSSPSFDPLNIPEALVDENKPLFNRVLSGLYPPGSVFKIITATAGLEEKAIDEQTLIEDTGEIRVGEFRFGNWYFDQYGRKEGEVDIVKALQRSNDIFFYQTGERVGADKIASWAEKFGYGKAVGLGLGPEAIGVVPSPAWKEKVKGERWFLGNTYHYAIGQGDLQVTPMQVHQMTAAIAAGGKKCKPHIVNEEVLRLSGGSRTARSAQDDAADFPSVSAASNECEEVGISKETLELVKEGMVAACAPGGTAFPFFNFSTRSASPSASSGSSDPSGEIDLNERVACKTGTAQFGDPLDRTHAWFTVFAPASAEGSHLRQGYGGQAGEAKPAEIVVTVLLEAAGEGSYQAAPVAKELLDYWFHKR